MVKTKDLATKLPCPYCGKLIDITEVTTCLQEPVKGEYEKKIMLKKNPQTTLKEANK